MIRLVSLLLALLAPAASPGAEPRQVYITADSAPGWAPSPAQDAQAEAAFDAYFAAVDAGRADAVFALRTPAMQAEHPLAAVEAELAAARVKGALIARRRLRTTWTKDPPGQPDRGLYAAIDFSARYQNADRDCGYLILYQPDGPALPRVRRVEENFIDNGSARAIAASQSPAALERIWAAMARLCPNYAPPP